MTDQQRWDSLSCATNGWGNTPNIDRLAREGVYFEQCYCTAPSCVPSRASFFNLDWPSRVGPMRNGDRWEHSWVERLQTSGYRTYNVGKMHTQPFDVPCGFDQRFIVENKDRFNTPRFYDDWDKYLKQLGVQPPTRLTTPLEPDYATCLGAYVWPLDKTLHWDHYVPDVAKWLIEDMDDKPLFMQIGFPGPHTPYDPPEEYLDRIDESSIPLPPNYDAGCDIPPLSTYREIMITGNHDGMMWNAGPSDEQLLRLRKYYAANVALIDEQVGQIIKKLEARGRLDNTIIIFTSDHGDNLGDHGQIQKWTMYDGITRVPAIVWAPGKLPAGLRSQELIAQFDLVPMLFALAGLELEEQGSAISALEVAIGGHPGRDYVFSEHGKCAQLPDIESMAMVRSKEWKLVAYPNREYGELYHLSHDPHEVNNLWFDPEYRKCREQLEAQVSRFRNSSS